MCGRKDMGEKRRNNKVRQSAANTAVPRYSRSASVDTQSPAHPLYIAFLPSAVT
jgi:hypothetical protein